MASWRGSRVLSRGTACGESSNLVFGLGEERLAIAQGRYAEAEGLARKSYDLGPRVGSLCARNWQTVVELREAAGDAAGADSARAQLASCAVKAPVRM